MAFKSDEQMKIIHARAKSALVHKERSMLPPVFIYDQKVLNAVDSPYADATRNFQGIPSVECTRAGRVITVFYSGKDNEGCGNFLLLQMSEDGGKNFDNAFLAVIPAAEGVRCFDPVIWMTPEGKLILFWNQSFGYFDGRSGVWYAICEDPDAEELRFGEPKRAANGVMMCKPLAKENGDWLLPAAVWPMRPFYDEPDCDGLTSWYETEHRYAQGYHWIPEEQNPNVYISRNKGDVWEYYGQTVSACHMFPEHMVFPLADGKLGMYIRYNDENRLGYAESRDGGRTWSDAVVSDIFNPCTRFCVRRTPSGRLLLINHQKGENYVRNRLAAYLSDDEGKTWAHELLLDERCQVSYPDVAFSPDGYIYIVYDYNRYVDKEILIAKITESDIDAGRIISKDSFLKNVVNKALGKNPNEEPT